MTRLRVSHVAIQPVLVWDDGDELTPGPDVEPVALPLSAAAGFLEGLPQQVADLVEKVAAGSPTQFASIGEDT